MTGFLDDTAADVAEVSIEVLAAPEDCPSILVEYADGKDWIPRSEIVNIDELGGVFPGDVVDIQIPQWLAEQKGMV